MKNSILILLILTLLTIVVQHSWALSPRDVLIVYNATLAESKDVAIYYAKRREVPLSNLLGLHVTDSERISRSKFDKDMAPQVRSAVKRIRKAGGTPSILLMFGIPLRVGGPGNKESGINFGDFFSKKVTEYQELTLQLSFQLAHLIQNPSPYDRPKQALKSFTTKECIEIAGKYISKASKHLTQQAQDKGIETRMDAISLFMRLTGISSTATLVKKQLLKKRDLKTGLVQNKILLNLDAILKQQLAEIHFKGVLPEDALMSATIVRLEDGVVGELRFWEKLKKLHANPRASASVDSELTLILADSYQLAGWLPNPFLKKYDTFPFIKKIRKETIMVARLDGPTPLLAKRLIDDAIETENNGLEGVFYIDTRGLKDKKKHTGYSWYDQHLTNLYDVVKKQSSMDIVIEDTPDLFPSGACPNTALYCGWYSLANYIDAFKWQKGSVGFHIASAEASTLKRLGSKVWCKRMIEEGVTATLGPVEEPYVSSFPLPDVFFPLLMTGKLPLLEVYFRSTPYLSWRQILIGDPLYTPFKKNPAIKLTKNKKGREYQ